MKSTGEKIRDQRRILGMTQRELAEAAGMTNRTVSKYETDMVVPRGMNLKKLCRVLSDIFKVFSLVERGLAMPVASSQPVSTENDVQRWQPPI